MWPLDWTLKRSSSQEIVRVGRLQVERWQRPARSLQRVGSEPLARPREVADLTQAVAALFADAAIPASGPVNFVLESAWLPLMLVDTGGDLWREAPVEALVRHRLRTLYARAEDDLSGWEVRVEFKPGERLVLGHGLDARVRHALLAGAAQHRLAVQSLEAAFLWGRRTQPASRNGWWVWTEQDRRLIACFEAGRLQALNSAADLGDVRRAVLAERRRQGRLDAVEGDEPITLIDWSAQVSIPGVTCHVLSGDLSNRDSSNGKARALA